MKPFTLIKTKDPIKLKSFSKKDFIIELWANDEQNYFWIHEKLNGIPKNYYGIRTKEIANLKFNTILNKGVKYELVW